MKYSDMQYCASNHRWRSFFVCIFLDIFVYKSITSATEDLCIRLLAV